MHKDLSSLPIKTKTTTRVRVYIHHELGVEDVFLFGIRLTDNISDTCLI